MRPTSRFPADLSPLNRKHPLSRGCDKHERRSPRRSPVPKPIHSPDAPKAIGPYSQAVQSGNLVFLSGQIPLDPATGQLVEGDIKAQTRRVMQNLAAVLEASGLTFAHV